MHPAPADGSSRCLPTTGRWVPGSSAPRAVDHQTQSEATAADPGLRSQRVRCIRSPVSHSGCVHGSKQQLCLPRWLSIPSRQYEQHGSITGNRFGTDDVGQGVRQVGCGYDLDPWRGATLACRSRKPMAHRLGKRRRHTIDGTHTDHPILRDRIESVCLVRVVQACAESDGLAANLHRWGSDGNLLDVHRLALTADPRCQSFQQFPLLSNRLFAASPCGSSPTDDFVFWACVAIRAPGGVVAALAERRNRPALW